MAISDDTKYSLTGAEIKTLASKVNEKAPASSVYTKTEIDSKLTSAMTYKGTVAAVADLPQSGNKIGDVYNVAATGDNYAWDGSNWDQLSGVVDLSNYYTKTETDTELSGKVDKVSGKGLSEEDFTTTEKTKLGGIESGAEENVIESISVNGTSQTVTNKNVDLSIDDGIKTLTTEDYDYPTSNPAGVALWLLEPGIYKCDASQVKMVEYSTESAQLKPEYALMIILKNNYSSRKTYIFGGNYLNMRYDTVDANGTNVMSGKVLTNNDIINALNDASTDNALSAAQGKVLKDLINSLVIKNAGAPTTSTVGTVGKLYEDSTNGKLYQCTAVSGSTYTWTEIGNGPTVVQTTGSSTTDVMSQKAVTSMIFRDPVDKEGVQIGKNSNISSYSDSVVIGQTARVNGNAGVAIGSNAGGSSSPKGSISLGAYAKASTQGQMSIGLENSTATLRTQYGYNGSIYRLLSGLYDPQSAHDAATKGYVDAAVPIMEITDTDPGADTTTSANTITFVYTD